MPFFTFRQNNSGGGNDIDESRGIGHYVIVEASDADHANYLARQIGVYFEGVAAGIDCDCCGDRWYQQWQTTGDAVPTIYGLPLKALLVNREPYDVRPDLAFVHHLDGRVVAYQTY